MTLTNFLLARIAEEREDWSELKETLAWDYPAKARRYLDGAEARARVVELLAPVAELSQPGAIALDCLRALALPYADHPDFDESWRP